MKILQVQRGREFEIRDVPVPDPGSGEVRVRIDAVTICTQWDLHLRHDSPMFTGHQFHYPYTLGQPGHEGSGVIDAVGAGVTEFGVGDRVSLWRDPGHGIQGCYAEYVVRPVSDVIRVPATLDAVSTAPLELAMCLACSIPKMRQFGAIEGQRVAVNGLGAAGLIAVQMLRAEGAASIAAIDPVASRRNLALELGADAAYDPAQAAAEFPSRSEAKLDAAIDCVGFKKSVEFLMDRVADVVALFGVQREDYTYGPQHWLGLTLVGYVPHYRGAAEYAADLLAKGQLSLRPLVSHVMPMSDYAAAVDLLEQQQATKIALLPGG